MTESAVITKNAKTILTINGKTVPACAYITYFDERSHCADFARAGYELYSVCASFSALPLNARTGFSPHFGIFETKGNPDFSCFDANVRQILDVCPNAKIFPRVRICMPQWWVDEHPEECCRGGDGRLREALYSDIFKETGEEMLREYIAHVQSSSYADHIVGYQLAGGFTEEWFHFDSRGSICPNTKKYFNRYLSEHCPEQYKTPVDLPDESLYSGSGLIEDEIARQFLAFANISIAETISYFAKVAKQCVDHRQIIGVFFGYVVDIIGQPLRGSSGLNAILNCPDIDFICSPNSYVSDRALGIDWHEPTAGASIRLHGKLYFAENDIRTYLSDYPDNCRPGVDPQKKYNGPIWKGPDSVQGSVSAVRKSFARQLTHSNALWWFDMWGGWYDCPELMAEMARFRKIMEDYTLSEQPGTNAQVALIVDESYKCRVGRADPSLRAFNRFRGALGNSGIPYDFLLAEDYRHCLSYQAVILPYQTEYLSDTSRLLKSFCEENGIAVIMNNVADASDINTCSLRNRLIEEKVHCYCDSGDVVYCGNGYLCIHAASAGSKTILLGSRFSIASQDGEAPSFISDVILLEMQKFETRLFKLTPVS